MKIIGGYPFGELEPARMSTTPDGWDVVTELRLAHTQNLVSTGDLRQPVGIQGTFYLQEKRCVGFIGCYPKMEYLSKGIHGSKDYTISGTGTAEIISGNFSGVPFAPSGSQPANVKVSRIGVQVRYVTRTRPDCSQVGKQIEPPEHFGISSYPFNVIVDPVYSVPAGWVLDNRKPDQLPGTGLFFVTDDYGYYFLRNVPAGG